ncbi:MAG: reverse transcriptase/maturase family protein [Oscillospiraceae bacterium]
MELKKIQGVEPPYSVVSNAYETMCDYEELYQCYLKARKTRRYRGDVLKYSANLEENLIITQNELLWESYNVGKYRPFYVYEPKKRLVMALQFKDRIVQWAIYRQINPFYDKMFIDDSYACRVGKGSHKAADRLQYWLCQASRKPEKHFYLKLDISKYFYRVDHSVIFEILSRRIKDERLINLLYKIINSEDTKFGLPAGVSPGDCPEDDWLFDVGMPIGNLTSQLFSNIYLNELDQFCKHELKLHCYVRYADDIIIVLDDKKELARIKEEIETFLHEKLHLDLNKKTTIRPISLGVDFVGYKIWGTHRKLKRQTARRIIRKIKLMCKQVDSGEITKGDFMRSAASYKGILKHCDSYGLRQALNEIYAKYAYAERGDENAD